MKKMTIASVALLAAACNTAKYDEAEKQRIAKGDAEVAERLAGYQAGETRTCLPSASNRDLERYSNRTLMLKQGGRIYVQQLDEGCRNVDRFGVTLVTKSTTGSYCRGDMLRLVDSSTGSFYGLCALNDWTVYEKTD